MMSKYIATIGLLILLFVTTACSSGSSSTSTTTPSSSPSALDGASLVQERCSVCHPLARVESSRHTAAEWKTIVDTMISRGAQLTPSEETVVVEYLSANFGQ